ncbi:MAG: MFS transporter [Eubacteriaceae bacterium]|nr:MFS transporter [Eubacteriaceae bacterium]
MINRNFSLLWMGKIVSQLGDKFYAIALAWWILQKTNSPSIMGFFLLVSVLPGILIGFFAGALTDRYNRKNIIIITDIIRGFLVLAITCLSIFNMLEIWHVFLIGLCLSLAAAFFDPAIQAIIPQIVEKENLVKANGMSQMVSGACTVAGPLLGALAVSILGLAWVFFANSISYFISAFLACFVKVNIIYKKPAKDADIFKEIMQGISFIKTRKQITSVLIIIALAHLFIGSLTVSLPFLAKALAGNGVNNLGYLQMMLGVGLFAGSIFMSIKKKSSVNVQTLILFIMAVGGCFIAISISQYLKINSVYIYMLVLAIIGSCIAFASVFWQSLLQYYTPEDMRGRVFSISTMVANFSIPLAYGLFGVLLNLSSMSILMASSGACLLLLCFCLYLRNSKNYKEMV